MGGCVLDFVFFSICLTYVNLPEAHFQWKSFIIPPLCSIKFVLLKMLFKAFHMLVLKDFFELNSHYCPIINLFSSQSRWHFLVMPNAFQFLSFCPYSFFCLIPPKVLLFKCYRTYHFSESLHSLVWASLFWADLCQLKSACFESLASLLLSSPVCKTFVGKEYIVDIFRISYSTWASTFYIVGPMYICWMLN